MNIVGHVVSKEGQQVSKKKNNKITTLPTPANVTELRGFLGLVTYIPISIKNLSEKAALLKQLTRKEAEWVWSGDCDKAFNRLKNIIGEDIFLKELIIHLKPGSFD